MLDAQQRIRLTLGDLLIQLAMAQERIETLEAELAQLRPEANEVKPATHIGGNGGMIAR